MSLQRSRPRRFHTVRIPLFLTAALGSVCAQGQTQSLAFTGGALLNPKVRFSNLGAHPAPQPLPAASGGAANRIYDDGYNRIDDGGNVGNSTAYWGYDAASQIQGDELVLSTQFADSQLSIEDAGDFLYPSGNLEYRGSLGPVGASDWGIILSIGYQVIGGEADASLVTDAVLIEDAYGLGTLAPADLPPAPYRGTSDPSGPRIGSVPRRTIGTTPSGRFLDGRWEFEGQFIPITGGLYLESQIAGRLNGVLSAGVMAMFIDSDFTYVESSALAGRGPVTSTGRDTVSDVILGGFVQLGLDWA